MDGRLVAWENGALVFAWRIAGFVHRLWKEVLAGWADGWAGGWMDRGEGSHMCILTRRKNGKQGFCLLIALLASTYVVGLWAMRCVVREARPDLAWRAKVNNAPLCPVKEDD